MVAAMVNVPQGLPGSAFTTTSADHRQQDDHDQQHRDQRDEAAHFADLFARHLSERFAVAPHGREEDHEILHRAAEHRADDDPERAGQIAELRREHGPDQRSGSGDGGEMMAEDDPLVGRARNRGRCRRRSAGVARWSLSAMTRAAMNLRVEAVADEIGAGGGQHQPEAVDVLSAIECDGGERDYGHARGGQPQQRTQNLHDF